MSFDDDVIRPIRARLARDIQVPSRAKWWVEQGADRVSIHLEIDARSLSQDIQTDLAAAPSFLVCLCYWLERATGRQASGRVRVLGEWPSENISKPHWNRAAFLLDRLQRALPGRLEVQVQEPWRWPCAPILNVARNERAIAAAPDAHPEHVLETFLCRDEASREGLCGLIGPIRPLARQLPVGLFEGRVAAASRWTPGGKAQVDLWSASADGRTVHLFELKAEGNEGLGIMPEAFYYLRLLHHVRVGLDNGTRIAGRSPALDAIRAAERLKMWLVAPKVHPLLLARDDSPLAWLNEGMRDNGVEIGILPIEIRDGVLSRWRSDERWPRPVGERVP